MELKSRKKKRGFSLLEIMIALSILGFGLLMASLGQLTAVKKARDSRSQSLAMYLAQQQMETFQSMPSDDVIAARSDGDYPNDPRNPFDPDPNDDNSTRFDRRWFVTLNDPVSGSLGLRVEVDYVNSLGVTRTVVLRSLKAEL
ncbi:MAG: prepilin-type N-terminal cleavage/methylation domain-containing protein [Deltaproteobacteria bacterium]|nr:prepilin-type N-terminal cleavage/methylation domain-containing protein [Deltaproteobacteria bacterium]